MFRIRHIMYAGLVALVASPALAQDFPQHPADMKEAEAQGLTRVGVGELKAFMPGTIQMKGAKGVEKTKMFKPDGSLEVSDARDKGGSWNFSKKHDGYCNEIVLPKKVAKSCYYVFKAKDGVHYFNYEVSTGHFAEVWRAAPKQ